MRSTTRPSTSSPTRSGSGGRRASSSVCGTCARTRAPRWWWTTTTRTGPAWPTYWCAGRHGWSRRQPLTPGRSVSCARRRRAVAAPSSREVKGTSWRWVQPACATPGHAAGGLPGPGHPRIMAPVSLPGLARGLDMIIDRETFTELAVHLKLASDAILKTARHLAVLSNGDSSNEEQWAGTLDSLMAMNTEITVMEKILRALMEANREEESPSLMVPDKKSEPLPS